MTLHDLSYQLMIDAHRRDLAREFEHERHVRTAKEARKDEKRIQHLFQALQGKPRKSR